MENNKVTKEKKYMCIELIIIGAMMKPCGIIAVTIAYTLMGISVYLTKDLKQDL